MCGGRLMKIMQVCFSPIVDSAGGAEKVYCNMANHFCEKNEVVNICCDNKVGQPFYNVDKSVKFINIAGNDKIIVPSSVKFRGEIVRILRSLGLKCTLPRTKYLRVVKAERLKKLLNIENPDVVICYDMDSAMSMQLTGFSKDKIIVMFHNKIERFLKNMTNDEKAFLKSIRKNQVLLESDKKKLEEIGFTNVMCIGNIVPKIEIPQDNKREKVIIHVGRLDKLQKRQHLAIEAFSKIASKYPDWTMKFIGGNSNPSGYEDELKNLIKKHGLEKQVFLAGTTSKVTDELLKASIFVFPSAFEGFGLAMTEAMSAGLPVLGFRNTPAVNELVVDGENGLLCDDNNETFAEAMSKLIFDTELRVSLGQKAKESVKKYSADAIFKQWEEVFSKMRGEV